MMNTWPGWESVEEIGKGSFGSVYKIQKEEYGHVYKAALKVISIPTTKSEVSSLKDMGMNDEKITTYYQNTIQNLSNEFALMAELKGNSNIVSYEDHKVIPRKDQFGWDILIRMELLTPLRKYIEVHPLSKADVVKMGIGLCNALEICQKKGILHRDIKPGNIFVNENGDFKLGDFGVSKIMESSTSMMTIVGTYNYMAPEVYKSEKYGYSSDLYSLAMVMYKYLNNGFLPFCYSNDSTSSEKKQILTTRMSGQRIPDLKNCDASLNKIILKCLEPDPKNRFQNASDLRQALEEYQKNGADSIEKIPVVKMIKCPYCSCEQVEGTRFCGNCGKDMMKKVVFCEKCGKKIPFGKSVCEECAKKQRTKKIAYIISLIVLILCVGAGALFYISDPNHSRDYEWKTLPEAGEIIYWGTYEQDNNKKNGKEPIEWICYYDDNDNLLLISKDILDYQPYGEGSWEECSLRNWLQNDFMNKAFNKKEIQRILTKENTNETIQSNNMQTIVGSNTKDQVFILRADEIEDYLSIYQATVSDYVKSEAKTSSIEYATRGMETGVGPIVDSTGNITKSTTSKVGVRPCIYVSKKLS